MCDAVRGEQDSPGGGTSRMIRIQAGAETPEGCPNRSPWATAEEVGAERMPIETLGRRRSGDKPGRKSAREEAGRNACQGVRGGPRGAKPRGASSGLRVKNYAWSPGTPGRGETQEPRPVQPASTSVWVYRQAKR